MSDDNEANARGTAVEKMFSILNALLDAQDEPSLLDLSDTTGMPKASVHRALAQLSALDLIQRNPATKRYMVGPALSKLAIRTMLATTRRTTVRALIQNVVNEIGETVNFGVLDEMKVMYIDRVECAQPLRLVLQAGSRVPIHTSSTGKMLLSHLPARRRRALIDRLELKPYTPFTITDKSKLEAETAEIRNRGYSTSNQEYLVGLLGVAVPVRLSGGDVFGALALHAPVARLPMERAIETVPILNAASAQIAEAMAGEDQNDYI